MAYLHCEFSDVILEYVSGWKSYHNGFNDMFFHQYLFSKKALSQWLHWYSFFPVCIFRWLVNWLLCEEDLCQWLHWYGFSPVCVIHKNIVYWKTLQHSLHWYGLSPVCLSRWSIRLLFNEKTLPHVFSSIVFPSVTFYMKYLRKY